MARDLLVGLLQLLVPVILLVIVVSALLPRPARRAAGRAGTRALGLLVLLGLAIAFTVSDALITGVLSAYHVATARPHLVPEDWLAFLHRLNDRGLRVLMHG